jgi:hypothetical protein
LVLMHSLCCVLQTDLCRVLQMDLCRVLQWIYAVFRIKQNTAMTGTLPCPGQKGTQQRANTLPCAGKGKARHSTISLPCVHQENTRQIFRTRGNGLLCMTKTNTAYLNCCRVFYLLYDKYTSAVKPPQNIKLFFFAVYANIAHGKYLCHAIVKNTHGKYFCRANLCHIRFALCRNTAKSSPCSRVHLPCSYYTRQSAIFP